MTDLSPRFALPLLVPGQAQKEVSHNEALLLLEALAQPIVESAGDPAPPASPAAGQAWIVGTAPTGAWAGQPDALALWTEGGWRFLPPIAGMAAFVRADGVTARFDGVAWLPGQLRGTTLTLAGRQVVGPRQPAIATPVGGGVIDAEGRATLGAILAALRVHGLIAT